MSETSAASGGRDPREVKTLEDALAVACDLMDRAAAGATVEAEQWTLAAGFIVLCEDMAAMLDAAKKATHFCGWCQLANGNSRVGLIAMPLDEIRAHTVLCDHNPLVQQLRQARADLDSSRAALRREQDARAELRVELDRVKAELAKLHHAAPVMLSVMALLADECDLKGLREVALWFLDVDPDHLSTWLDAEHARVTLAATKTPCCPSAALPGGTHDIGCRGTGKVH